MDTLTLYTTEPTIIKSPIVETDGDDCITFTCPVCVRDVTDGRIFVTGMQYDPDNETVAEFALSAIAVGMEGYEAHFMEAHG